MLTFTRRDGKKFTIDGKSVLRVRQTIESDKAGQRVLPGNTRLDSTIDYYAMEPLADVVTAVKTELTTLVEFRSRSGVPIWINAKEAEGPLPVSQSEIKDGIHSRLRFGSLDQVVGNTHQEVHDAISAAGGKVLPIPTDGANLNLDTATVGDLKSHIEANYNLPLGLVRIVNSEGKAAHDDDIVAQLLKGHGNREKR